MKKIVLLSSMLFLTVCTKSLASTSEYIVDDVAIEATLNSGVEVASLVPTLETSATTEANVLGVTNTGLPATTISGGKDATTAFILSWFLGILGVHRFYMGTATLTGVGYILTLGGCGIVATVDWVVLLIALVNKEGISKYEDNPKFFMWGGN
ncbi:MAG: TM2 domain-containing protein [Spirosomataceae bacterium]